MELTVPTDEGEDIRFECADTWVSKWVCEAILQGKTYPLLGFVDEVTTIFDVGANCGATAVFLARAYPQATVHAFEPAAEPYGYLNRNVASLPNVTAHRIGLGDRDEVVPLFHGVEDSITGSVLHRDINRADSEQITLRAAGAWAAERGIERIDLMKVDVEGCEVAVLESLEHLLPTVKVLYVEYDSRTARRRIDDILRPTHDLYFAMFQALDQGECVYLHRDLADHPDANQQILDLLRPATEQAAT